MKIVTQNSLVATKRKINRFYQCKDPNAIPEIRQLENSCRKKIDVEKKKTKKRILLFLFVAIFSFFVSYVIFMGACSG